MKASFVFVWLAVSAFAAETPEQPQRLGFIGEGGGYKHPDPAADDYLNTVPSGIAPAPPAKNTPSSVPPASASIQPAPGASTAETPAAPRAGHSRSSAPADASRAASPDVEGTGRAASARLAEPPASAASRRAPNEAEPRTAGRQSLWNGLMQPLAPSPADANAADPDTAREGAGRDYETHILGAANAPARPALAAREAPVSITSIPAPASQRSESGGKVFVSLALDPREAGSLRDAVAGLGVAVGFSADARFQAMPGPHGTVLYSGWIPPEHLGDVLSRPGVKSLRVETRSRPASPTETTGEFLIGLRVADAAQARRAADAGVSALASAAGFRLSRVVGLETAPDGRSVVVVAGTLPLSRLSRAMGLPEVAKIVPTGGEMPAPSGATAPGGVAGFAAFVAGRWPWLILATLLLLLPGLRSLARGAAAVFSPYQ